MVDKPRGNPVMPIRLRKEIQDMIRTAAKRDGLGIAQWVERAVLAYLEPATPGAAAGGRHPTQETLNTILERLARLEDRVDAVAEVSRRRGSQPKEGQAKVVSPVRMDGRQRMLSPETTAEAVRLYSEGLGQRAIAQRIGATKDQVAGALRRAGIAAQNSKQPT